MIPIILYAYLATSSLIQKKGEKVVNLENKHTATSSLKEMEHKYIENPANKGKWSSIIKVEL